MKHRVPAALVPEGGVHVFEVEGVEVALFNHGGRYRAINNRCPHVRGPLSLGRVEGDEVICPWHGARFALDCGRATFGPTKKSVAVYEVRLIGDEIEIDVKLT